MRKKILFVLVLALGLASGSYAAEGIWTTKAPMPTARYYPAVGVVNGIIYVSGGVAGDELTTVEAYDPLTDTWTSKASLSMAEGGGGCSVLNGKIYVIGGTSEAYTGPPLGAVQEYDVATDTWEIKADMPTARAWVSSSVVDGKIYVIGGAVVAYGAPLSTVEEYDPVTDTWTSKADMPTARVCVSTSAVNGKIYAIGGSPGDGKWYQGLTIVEEYDPSTDTWTRKADMPTGRTYFSTCVVNGKIYAIGGVKSGGGHYVSKVEEYDPATDTWTAKADIPTAREGLATSAVNGKIYAIGGWVGSPISTVEEYEPYPLIVDFNGDGIVDIEDLLIMIDNWDTDESLCDIGPMPCGDGIVDKEDLIIFMSHWGEDYTLVAHWKLDETEGDVAYDSIGENDGTIYGTPLWQPSGGYINGALEFDGINDYISTPRVLELSPGPFSIFAWIKGGLPGQVILSQSNRSDWLAADATDGSLKTELTFLGKPKQTLLSQAVITDGNWHRLGLVWDGSNRILYVDDNEVASDTYVTGSLVGDLQIGAGNKLEAGTFFSGLIDDVRIYNRAITP